MVEKIKQYFTNGRFSFPATEKEVNEVENKLGIKIPAVLKELYLSFDGFREGTGNSSYLIPLRYNEGTGSLVEINKFYWGEYMEYYPNLNFKNYLFFGSSSSDEIWGINLDNETEIIAYHHHMEDEYEIAGNDISQVYINDQESFRESIG